MARSFSEDEKKRIGQNLIIECEKSWASYGYKKTNIDQLCGKVGISKGAFYLFFDSKEWLFCSVLDTIQERMMCLIAATMTEKVSKQSISQMLKKLYLEYDKTNILTQRNNPDFIAFLNRAPEEWKQKSRIISDDFIMNKLFDSQLQLKMEKQKAVGIFNALLSIVTNKETIGYDHFEVFSTLLDSVIDKIYE
ncbi:TetR/AcrR family transcriptional regulator [Enterococcus sp. 669A]|uniref:TetR/AcrR family transcriptional regulator n=1 Tax=Candidatus Enterococcus moelleringii TaxID=2815325 RepID=A0ABS3LDF7_9ENTE|nr:TetR/AcrR family transcriptional regulator [Enterococcus sp. 669A]MBO1307663.1 TetR/AcrR family transcriptional regulator [Enterococcus sp. 669A]